MLLCLNQAVLAALSKRGHGGKVASRPCAEGLTSLVNAAQSCVGAGAPRRDKAGWHRSGQDHCGCSLASLQLFPAWHFADVSARTAVR